MGKRERRSELLRVRVTPHEKFKIEWYAERHGLDVSHVLREYIRRLPNARAADLQRKADELSAGLDFKVEEG
jgi:hypothetical protein